MPAFTFKTRRPDNDLPPSAQSEPADADRQAYTSMEGTVVGPQPVLADAAGRPQPVVSPVEAHSTMDHSEELPPAYPFAAADMDIDMIDKLHASPNGAAIAAASATGNPVELARQLTLMVEKMVRQLNDQQAYTRQLEHRVSTIEENSRAYDSLKQTLREVAGSGITDEDVQTLQRVMQALAQDPNHIMVLASVAQQAPKLQSIIASFAKLYAAVKQAPPR